MDNHEERALFLLLFDDIAQEHLTDQRQSARQLSRRFVASRRLYDATDPRPLLSKSAGNQGVGFGAAEIVSLAPEFLFGLRVALKYIETFADAVIVNLVEDAGSATQKRIRRLFGKAKPTRVASVAINSSDEAIVATRQVVFDTLARTNTAPEICALVADAVAGDLLRRKVSTA